jgi:hypothetical protein
LWWAGAPANPARFAVAALPAETIPLACLWHCADDVRRRMLLALLGVSLAISAIVIGIDHGNLAWNMRDAEARWLEWLGPLVNLPRGLPSFFWRLDPAALRSETAFAVHAGVWLGAFAGGWMVLRSTGRARLWTASTWRLGIALWLLTALLGTVQIGWWMNRVTGIDAARSQMTVLSAGRSIWSVAPWTLRQNDSLADRIRVRNEECGRTDGPPPWLALDRVPAGTYAVHISSSRPKTGELTVIVGRSQTARSFVPVNALSHQTASLTLPAGAAWLTLMPKGALEGTTGTVELEPKQLTGFQGFARSESAFGAARVSFLDDFADPEPRGFWVLGGRSTEIALHEDSDAFSAPATLALRNGRARNEVTVEAGTRQQWTLSPLESREVEVTLRADRPVRVRITSRAGFRPSDTEGSADTRFLGVWVELHAK